MLYSHFLFFYFCSKILFIYWLTFRLIEFREKPTNENKLVSLLLLIQNNNKDVTKKNGIILYIKSIERVLRRFWMDGKFFFQQLFCRFVQIIKYTWTKIAYILAYSVLYSTIACVRSRWICCTCKWSSLVLCARA